MRTHPRRKLAALSGSAVILMGLVGAAPSAHATATLTQVWSYKLRAGVKVKEYYSASPLIRAFVLSVTPSALGTATMDNVAAGSTITSVAATSTIASKAHAVAAINADFGAFVKRTEHAYLQNGELW